jgi:hypothetical protein
MKKITPTLLVLFAILFNYSCDSEDAQDVLPVDNFFALTVGNSWEYTYYIVDIGTTNFLPTSVTETVDITHSVEIDNKTYYNFRHRIQGNDGTNALLPQNEEKNFVLRDSLGFLVGPTARIAYSSQNYDEHITDIFEGAMNYTYYLQLSEGEVSLNTNAGNFSCLENEYFVRDSNGNRFDGTSHVYRENGIGEVVTTFTFVSQSTHFMEKRLESFSVQ